MYEVGYAKGVSSFVKYTYATDIDVRRKVLYIINNLHTYEYS